MNEETLARHVVSVLADDSSGASLAVSLKQRGCDLVEFVTHVLDTRFGNYERLTSGVVGRDIQELVGPSLSPAPKGGGYSESTVQSPVHSPSTWGTPTKPAVRGGLWTQAELTPEQAEAERVLRVIRQQPVTAPLVQALLHVVETTEKPAVRDHTLKLSFRWLAAQLAGAQVGAQSPGQRPVAPRTRGEYVLEDCSIEALAVAELVLRGLTDVWSAIRKASVEGLLRAEKGLSPAQLEFLQDRLLERLEAQDTSWQQREGALMGITALLRVRRRAHVGASAARAAGMDTTGEAPWPRPPPPHHMGPLTAAMVERHKVTIYDHLAHAQLSVREAAVRAFTALLNTSPSSQLQGAGTMFFEVMSRLLPDVRGGAGGGGGGGGRKGSEGQMGASVQLLPAPMGRLHRKRAERNSTDAGVVLNGAYAAAGPAPLPGSAAEDSTAAGASHAAGTRRPPPSPRPASRVPEDVGGGVPGRQDGLDGRTHGANSTGVSSGRHLRSGRESPLAQLIASSRLGPIVSMGLDGRPLLDAYEAEGVLGAFTELVRWLPPSFLLEQWDKCFAMLELYLAHPASTVRQVASKVFKYLVSKNQGGSPWLVHRVLHSLTTAWTAEPPRQERPREEMARHRRSASFPLDFTWGGRGGVEQIHAAKGWEWWEGRLFVYELLLNHLLSNHAEKLVDCPKSPSPSPQAGDPAPGERPGSGRRRGGKLVPPSATLVVPHDMSLLDQLRATEAPRALHTLRPRYNKHHHHQRQQPGDAVNWAPDAPRGETHDTTCNPYTPRAHSARRRTSLPSVGSATGLEAMMSSSAVGKTPSPGGGAGVGSFRSNSAVDGFSLPSALASSAAAGAFSHGGVVDIGMGDEARYEPVSSLLQRMFHQILQCFGSARWEVRRMGMQVLPPLTEAILWFDPAILDAILRDYLAAGGMLPSYVACLSLKHAVHTTARLQQLLQSHEGQAGGMPDIAWVPGGASAEVHVSRGLLAVAAKGQPLGRLARASASSVVAQVLSTLQGLMPHMTALAHLTTYPDKVVAEGLEVLMLMHVQFGGRMAPGGAGLVGGEQRTHHVSLLLRALDRWHDRAASGDRRAALVERRFVHSIHGLLPEITTLASHGQQLRLLPALRNYLGAFDDVEVQVSLLEAMYRVIWTPLSCAPDPPLPLRGADSHPSLLPVQPLDERVRRELFSEGAEGGGPTSEGELAGVAPRSPLEVTAHALSAECDACVSDLLALLEDKPLECAIVRRILEVVDAACLLRGDRTYLASLFRVFATRTSPGDLPVVASQAAGGMATLSLEVGSDAEDGGDGDEPVGVVGETDSEDDWDDWDDSDSEDEGGSAIALEFSKVLSRIAARAGAKDGPAAAGAGVLRALEGDDTRRGWYEELAALDPAARALVLQLLRV